MSLTKFYTGLYSDLAGKPYEDGALYFVFPEETPSSLGHIYLDTDNTRKEISSAYNDSSILTRLSELERIAVVRCESVTIENPERRLAIDGAGTFTASIYPFNTTDVIAWSSSDNNIAIVESFTYDAETGITTAIIRPQAIGVCSINVQCGQCSAAYSLEVINEQWFISYLLASEFSPNGDSFSYTAPIALQNEQYIETKIDLSGVNAIKQNLISLGQDIDKFTESRTPKIHIYSSQTLGNKATHLRLAFIYTTNKTGIEYPIPNRDGSIVTIRLDYEGLWINGVQFVPPDNATKLVYDTVIEESRKKASFEVGSLEGANRSTAYYDYIKYVKYEPTV